MKNTANFLLLLTLWLVFGSVHSQPDTSARKLSQPGNITAGNAPVVSATLHPKKFTLLNKGVSGHNTRDLLARLDTDVLALKPKLVILKVGTNDMVNSKKMVLLAEYEQNLTRLVSRINASGATVLLLTPLPVDDAYLFTRHDRSLYHKTPTDHIRHCLAVVKQVARKQQVGVIDTYQLFVDHGEPKRTADSWLQNEANANRSDGVHPNAAGYGAMARLVADYLRDHKLPTEGIICFGDSITYGLNVAGAGTTEGDSYPAQLAHLL